MHLVLFLDFQKHPMRRGAQNMPVLRRVKQLKDIKTVAEEISKDRKKRILEHVFTSRTGCQTWEEASERYALHAEEMEEFLGKASINLCFLNIIHYKLLVK